MSTTHEQFHNLLFEVRRSVRYHLHRRRFFEGVQDFTIFLSVVMGSSTIATFSDFIGSDAMPLWVKLLPAALATILSSIVLVKGVSRKISLHADFARQFIELQRELEACRSNPTEESLAGITDKLLAIEMSELPILRALDMICYNEVIRSMYPDPEYKQHQYKIGPMRRYLAQFRAFHTVQWEKA